MTKHRGTGRDYSLWRLSRDAPALYGDVLAGRLTPHAAMIQAGLRPLSFTVRASSPEVVAATIRRRLPPDWVAEVAAYLAA